MLCLSGFSMHTQAQALTEFDKSQIERRARLKMDEFEELLYLISDPTRSRGAVDRYIISSYSEEDSLFNQVFYDKDVIIEDDISRIDLSNDNIEVSALDVVSYLNNFKLQYAKNVEKTVHFTDYSFSEAQTGDYPYIVVSYTSTFDGKNIQLGDYTYPPVKRKATLRAAYDFERDAWQVWIAGVNFDRDAITDSQEKTSVIQDNKVVENTPPPVVSTPPKEEELPALAFTAGVPSSIKKGQSIRLRWNTPVSSGNLKLNLNQDNRSVIQLNPNVNGEQWEWKVNQKPGKNYSITLFEPSTNRSTTSNNFQIKPRFPLAVKVAIPVAVIAATILILDPFGPKPPPPPPTTDLDLPPALPTTN